jgi:protein-S-isoprenylcysteine O-methyltransferase Ste14
VAVRPALGKVLYALLFVVILPVVLAAWAHALVRSVALPAYASPAAGGAVLALGVALVLAGMHALWVHGGGLPMNAFPPPRLATRGAYALTRHPIYVGFVLACGGASIAVGSAAGLWLVTPLAALGTVALVYGFELPDLVARFGALPSPAVRLPPALDRSPTAGERVAAYLLVLVPWAVLYEAVAFLGPPADAVDGTLALDRAIPVVPEAEVVYASAYVVVLAVPLLAARARDLRAFMVRGLLAMALVFPAYLALPIVAPPRPFTPHDLLGHVLAAERALDTPAAAFPSFHVIWALLAAEALGARGRLARALLRTWAWGVAASCALTGMHTLVDIAAGAVATLAVVRAGAVWQAVRAATERVANSWREVRLGPLRVINHGAWAGLATFAGLAIGLALAGPAYATPLLVAGGGGLVGAAMWAQLVEGSPSLLRPYGFYGGLLGIVLASFACPLFGADTWVLLASYAVAGPVVQSLGRVRCLVQGCCHGRAAPPGVGIRYTHPRSRVCRLAHLEGVPVHATPLYSIAWNVVVLAVVLRAFVLHAPTHLVGGLYLVLGGLGRFVEESLRGEPQTKVLAKLRLYQWASIAQVIAGMLVSALGRGPACPTPSLAHLPLLVAAAGGVVAAIALGVDFPDSSRRFSRLA